MNNNKKLPSNALLLCFWFCLAILCNPLHANELPEHISLNGFFTLDASIADTDTDLVGGRELDDDEVNFSHSLIGAQAQFNLTDNLSLYTQGSLIVDRDEKIAEELDWAYLSYDFKHDFTLRLGRFRPAFLQGIELRNIGYSRIWARPLIPGAGASGFNRFHGLDTLKKFNVGKHHWQVQTSLGKAEHNNEAVNADTMLLGAIKYSTDRLWMRAAVMHVEYEFTAPDNIQIDSADALLASFEAEWQWQNWQLNLGLSEGSSDETPDDAVYYLSLAYSVDAFSPYVFVSSREQDFDDSGDRRPPGQGPPMQPGWPPPGAMRVPRQNDSQRDVTAIGIRWDWLGGYAVKFQLERAKDQFTGQGNQPQRSDHANIASFVIEGIF